MTRGDVLAVVLAAATVGTLYARYWQAPVAAALVEVRVGGESVGRYPLMQNRRLQIEGRMGISELAIEDGRVRFLHSPCRNQICVHSGWLSHSGDAAACLPNRVSLSLLGEAGESLDGVAF